MSRKSIFCLRLVTPLLLALLGGSNMHNDAYVNDAPGPLGLHSIIRSRTQGFGGYGTLTFYSKGRIVAIHGNATNFQLELLDADTLQELASFDQPPHSWMKQIAGRASIFILPGSRGRTIHVALYTNNQT